MRRAAIAAAGLAAAATLAACQPADDPELERPGQDGGAAVGDLEAAPDPLPADLDGLLQRVDREARAWRDEPVLAELAVELDPEALERAGDDGDGAMVRADALLVAADAEHLLELEVTDRGVRGEQRFLDGFGIAPLPAGAVADVEPLTGVIEPAELAGLAATADAGCDVDRPVQVRYLSGAPWTWDDEWAEPPAWTAHVRDADGAGIVLDPSSGEPTGAAPCLLP